MNALRLGACSAASATEPHRELPGAFELDQRKSAGEALGAGTLACARCDAPVGIGTEPLSLRTP